MNDKWRSYEALVKFLGQTLGSAYEVFVCDFTDPASPIVAIENGEVSGRSVGSLMRDETRQLLLTHEGEETGEFLIRRDAVGPNGRRYLSSTKLLKDENGEPIGALVINFNMEPILGMQEMLRSMGAEDTQLAQVDLSEIILAGEVVPDRVASLDSIYTHVMNRMDEMETDRTRMRQNIINALYKEGAFDIKGAVPFYAQRLAISEPSVYRYLQRAKKTMGPNEEGRR